MRWVGSIGGICEGFDIGCRRLKRVNVGECAFIVANFDSARG